MATKKATTPTGVKTTLYMRTEVKKKLEAIASAQQRGSGPVIGDALDVYVKQLPPAEKQLFDLFMKR